MLATSRRRLGVEGEQVSRSLALPVHRTDDPDPAVVLFIDRVRDLRAGTRGRVRPGHRDLRPVPLVEGLPLAIELAAARAVALSRPRSSPRSPAGLQQLGDPASSRASARSIEAS